MKLIEWINGVTKLNKNTMEQFQKNIDEEITEFEKEIHSTISGSTGAPIGSGMDYFGKEAPEGYMFADGSAISRTEYEALFKIIGTTYGTGNGTTTFNLPDKRERVSVMYSSNSKNGTKDQLFNTLGAKGGEFTHTITVNEMPEHTHIQNAHSHNIAGRTAGGSSYPSEFITGGGSSGSSTNYSTKDTTAVNQNTGGGQSMNMYQPYFVCNYIIKVL